MEQQEPKKRRPGRPPGAQNKRSLEFKDIMERHKFCPVVAMIEVFNEAKRQYERFGLAEEGQQHDIAHKYLRICGDMSAEIASYSFPKRRAIEANIDPTLISAIKALEDKSEQELLAILEGKPA